MATGNVLYGGNLILKAAILLAVGTMRIAPAEAAESAAVVDAYDYGVLLENLKRIPSVSGDLAGVNRIVRFMESLLKHEGFHVAIETMADGRQVIFAATEATKTPDVLFSAHLDTVAAIHESQYVPQRRDGIVYGRGASDCKEHCVLSFRLMRELRGKVSVGCLFGTDEEIGGASTAFMLDRGYGARKLVFVLDSEQYAITTRQKGLGGYVFSKEIPAYHSAFVSGKPQNAVVELARRYLELEKCFADAEDGSWRDLIGCTRIDGNAHKAELEIRVRAAEKDSWDCIEKLWKEKMGDAEFRCTRRGDAVILDEHAPYLLEFRERMRRKWPDRKVNFYHLNSSTDARHLQRLGLPMIITGIDARGAHSAKEYCILSSMDENDELIRQFVLDTICGCQKSLLIGVAKTDPKAL